MDFLNILQVLKKRLWIILLVPFLAIVFGYLVGSRLEKQFKSEAQIATGFTSDDAVNLTERANSFEITTRFTNIIESMKSFRVMSLVSYRLIIHDLETDTPFRGMDNASNDKSEFVLDDSSRVYYIQQFKKRLEEVKILNSYDNDDYFMLSLLRAYRYDVESLEDKFGIKRISTSDFISVEFISENPFLSAFASNAMCQEFIRYNRLAKSDRSSESIEFLEKLVTEKKSNLDTKSAELNEYKLSSTSYTYGAEASALAAQIAEYELRKSEEEKNVRTLQLSIVDVDRRLGSYTGVNSNEIAQVNQRIIEIRKRIDDLNAVGGDQNQAELERLRGELRLQMSRLDHLNGREELKTEMKDLQNQKTDLELKLRIAESNLTAIESSLFRLKSSATGQASSESRLGELQREVDVASEEYVKAQENLNQARNKSVMVGTSLKQVLEAQPTTRPEPTKLVLIMALAGISSFVICVVVVLLLDNLTFTLKVPEKLERQTGLRSLGLINTIGGKMELKQLFSMKERDPQAQAFVSNLRKLRFEVQNTKAKVFLVSSTQPGVGKSFALLSMAHVFSLTNKKVLIIDTNFKNNSLTKALLPQVDASRLLSRNNRLLEEKTGASSATEEKVNGHEIIYDTEVKGVSIMGNIGGSESPVEVLSGKDFEGLIERLRDKYDYIFLEGPSLNDHSDSKELVEYVDKVIAVFSAESTLNNLDMASIKYLRSIKAKLAGAVLNRVDLRDVAS